MRTPSFLAAVLLIATAGAVAQENTEPQYQVEMIVVRHLTPSTGTEVFPMMMEDAEADGELTEPERPGETFTPVDSAELTLTEMAGKIARSRNFRVVSHTGWVQPGFSREDARRKIVLRTAQTGESIRGDVVLSRERYLRLAFDLVLQVEGEQYQLNAQRRMISRQVHYFDNPHFGVIAKITPL